MNERVFAYGTLTDPDRLESVLGGGGRGMDEPVADDRIVEYEPLGPARLEGLRRVDGRYPTLVPGGSVEGTLLTVDATGLERLDAYEGVDRGLYVRVPVPMSDGDAAWIYVGDPDRLGVDDPDGWPGTGALEERIEGVLEEKRIVITPRE